MTSTLPLAAPLGLEEVLRLAQRYGATYVRTAEGLEVQMQPKRPESAQDVNARASALEPTCPCGHPLNTEHSDAGCLQGCSHERCTPSAPNAD